MTDIKTLDPSDKNYTLAKNSNKSKPRIDYAELAKAIGRGERDELLQLEVESRDFYGHIKKGLSKRRVYFEVDYSMSFRTVDVEGESKKYIFITIKG